jgi:autotransporter strand-loop-strand O-heptosyltransferase
MDKPDQIVISFCPGPHVEVFGDGDAKFQVRFSDAATGRIVYETTLTPTHWAEPGPKYYVDWRIQVEENGQRVIDYRLDLKDKRVLVVLNSTAMGDTIAWMPCVLQFQEKHGCKVIVQTHWNQLFESVYPELKFEEPKTVLAKQDYFCAYVVGCFDNDYQRNKNNWRSVPLQQIASDYLGLDYHCQRPRIARSSATRPLEGRYVAISEFANGYLAKQWLFPGGWQRVVDYLIEQGYQVVSVSKEPSKLERVIKFNDRPIEETVNNIQHAEFFVGCSSGPSLLAWALGVPTVVISGFTQAWGEVEGLIRVINEQVCHGCINDPSAPLDRANFLYCPRGKGMTCSHSITPEVVIEAVSSLTKPASQEKRILILMPHASTGGMPQYVVKQVQDLKTAGWTLAAAEWQNLSDLYTVQRKRLQAMLGPRFHPLNQSDERLFQVIEEFEPDVVHCQEAPEMFLPGCVAANLFSATRNYRLVVTTHDSGLNPSTVRWQPDAWAFVSQFHAKLYQQFPQERRAAHSIVEYRLPKRVRPERAQALQALGLNPKSWHVLSVGLFCDWKNQREIWDVARLLPHVQFICIGNQAPNFASYWEPLMADKPKNVSVLGERDDVDRFYAAADALLFPSKKELFPLVVVEAISWGLPVFMRRLASYCGHYDYHPLVTYIDENTEETACEISELLPSMADPLLELYQARPKLEEVPA